MTDKNQLPLEPEDDILLSEMTFEEETELPLDDDLMELEEELWTEESEDPIESESDLFSDPYVEHSIEADEQAYAYHGMQHPSDPEPDYAAYLYEEPAQEEADPAGSFRDPLADEEFPAIFSGEQNEAEKEDSQSKARPAHKGRPKRKKGAGLWGIPHLLSSARAQFQYPPGNLSTFQSTVFCS